MDNHGETNSVKRVKISAVICTYNRERFLRAAIESILDQNLPRNDFEILVINNNSTDSTSQIVADLQKRDPEIRCISEGRQGLSHARNRAIREARGRYLAFLDDDAIASPAWLSNILRAFESVTPSPAVVGGPTLLTWEVPKPEWCVGEIATLVFSYSYYGDKDCWLEHPKGPAGANVAYDREFFLSKGLLFPTSLGRVGSNLLSGEESELLRQCRLHGAAVYYCAEAIVHHFAPKERATVEYARRRLYWEGRSRVVRWIMTEGFSHKQVALKFVTSVRQVAKRSAKRLFAGESVPDKCWRWYWVGQSLQAGLIFLRRGF